MTEDPGQPSLRLRSRLRDRGRPITRRSSGRTPASLTPAGRERIARTRSRGKTPSTRSRCTTPTDLTRSSLTTSTIASAPFPALPLTTPRRRSSDHHHQPYARSTSRPLPYPRNLSPGAQLQHELLQNVLGNNDKRDDSSAAAAQSKRRRYWPYLFFLFVLLLLLSLSIIAIPAILTRYYHLTPITPPPSPSPTNTSVNHPPTCPASSVPCALSLDLNRALHFTSSLTSADDIFVHDWRSSLVSPSFLRLATSFTSDVERVSELQAHIREEASHPQPWTFLEKLLAYDSPENVRLRTTSRINALQGILDAQLARLREEGKRDIADLQESRQRIIDSVDTEAISSLSALRGRLVRVLLAEAVLTCYLNITTPIAHDYPTAPATRTCARRFFHEHVGYCFSPQEQPHDCTRHPNPEWWEWHNAIPISASRTRPRSPENSRFWTHSILRPTDQAKFVHIGSHKQANGNDVEFKPGEVQLLQGVEKLHLLI